MRAKVKAYPRQSRHSRGRCGVTRKVRFGSHDAALIRAAQILSEGARGTDAFRAYGCEYCGGWHLTAC
jgi:hypothetical protein